jgi:hypothetical protein
MNIETEKKLNITIDDVRAVLVKTEIDARSTNSGAVRKLLGERGSLGTIQKFLEVLRIELEPKPVEMAGSIPVVPKDLCDALWQSAWISAQASTASALATALLERDASREAHLTTAADLETTSESADGAITAANEAKAAETAATAEAGTAREALEALKTESAAAALAAENKLDQALKNAEALIAGLTSAHKLEISQAETKIATLAGVIDRLTDNLAEAKSMLPRNSDVAK